MHTQRHHSTFAHVSVSAIAWHLLRSELHHGRKRRRPTRKIRVRLHAGPKPEPRRKFRPVNPPLFWLVAVPCAAVAAVLAAIVLALVALAAVAAGELPALRDALEAGIATGRTVYDLHFRERVEGKPPD